MQTTGGHGRKICWQKNPVKQAGASPQEIQIATEF
jgi:hypothetical protein